MKRGAAPLLRVTGGMAWLMVTVTGGTPARAQNPPDTPDRGRPLQIDAVAHDRHGNPVTDLKPQDLEVWINGYRIPIETLVAFTPASRREGGRMTVLLLDDLTVHLAMVPRAKQVARRFVTRMLPGDRMAIVRLNGDSVEFAGDASRLLRRIDAHRPSTGVMPVDQLGAHLLGTVAVLARQLAEAPEQRKTIVAIGSGWLLDTPVPPPQIAREVRREWFDAVRALAVSSSTYYVIDPGGVGGSRSTGSAGFARETGGQAFTNTNDLNGAVDRILREADHYYVIGVSDPPVGRTASVRELEIKVLRKGITVRARRSIAGGKP